MAVISKSVFGSISGKVGEGVAYELNGQYVLRSLPKKRLGPLSEKEKLNRMKFKASQKWLAPLLPFLRIGFKGYQPRYEGFVAAKSYNHKHALKLNDDGKYDIDPALALISFGTQTLPETASVLCTPEHKIVVSWSVNIADSATDLVMLVLYNVKDELVNGDFGRGRRVDGEVTYEYMGSKPAELHVYLAFSSFDLKNRTNSMYLGKVNII